MNRGLMVYRLVMMIVFAALPITVWAAPTKCAFFVDDPDGGLLADLVLAELSISDEFEFFARENRAAMQMEQDLSAAELLSQFPHAELLAILNTNEISIIDAHSSVKYVRQRFPRKSTILEKADMAVKYLQMAAAKRNHPKLLGYSIYSVNRKGEIRETRERAYRDVVYELENAILSQENIYLFSRNDLHSLMRERDMTEKAFVVYSSSLHINLDFEINSEQKNDLIISLHQPFSTTRDQEEVGRLRLKNVYFIPPDELRQKIIDFLPSSFPVVADPKLEAQKQFGNYRAHDCSMMSMRTYFPQPISLHFLSHTDHFLLAALALDPENITYKIQYAYWRFNAATYRLLLVKYHAGKREISVDELRADQTITNALMDYLQLEAENRRRFPNHPGNRQYIEAWVLLYRINPELALRSKADFLAELGNKVYFELNTYPCYVIFYDLVDGRVLPNSILDEIEEVNSAFAQCREIRRADRHPRATTAASEFVSKINAKNLVETILSEYPPVFDEQYHEKYVRDILTREIIDQFARTNNPRLGEALAKVNPAITVRVLDERDDSRITAVDPNGVIYFIGRKNAEVYKSDLAGGNPERLFAFDKKQIRYISVMEITDNELIVFSGDMLYFLHLSTGDIVRKFELSFRPTHIIAVGNRIYFATNQIISCNRNGEDWKIEFSTERLDKQYPEENLPMAISSMRRNKAGNGLILFFTTTGNPKLYEADFEKSKLERLPELTLPMPLKGLDRGLIYHKDNQYIFNAGTLLTVVVQE